MITIDQYKKIFIIFILFLISACSGTISTLQMEGQTPQMFPINEKVAEKIISSAMASELKGKDLTRIELPNIGYQTTYRFALDSHTVVAYIIPAKGKNSEGNIVEGYIFEVSNSGSMPISGNHRANKVFNKIIEEANKIIKPLPLMRP